MSSLKVGWGEKVITPFAGKIIIAGVVPFRATDIVHDDIKATAMVIEQSGKRIIWVSCDFCHPSKQVEDCIISKLRQCVPDFKDDEFILSSTHATACFYLSDKEILEIGHLLCNDKDLLEFDKAREHFCNAAVESVIEALSNLEEEYISYASMDILTGYCRRSVYKDGSAVMYGDVHRDDFLRMEYPDGGESKVLYFYQKETRELKGILAAVPCPAQADEPSAHITADYWGYARECIKDEFGNDVKLLGLCRSAGELSPHKLFARDNSAEWGVAAAKRLGLWIADNLIKFEKNPDISDISSDSVMKYTTAELDFPARKITSEEYNKAKKYLNTASNYDSNGNALDWGNDSNARHMVKFVENSITNYLSKVSVIQLGDVVFFTAPAELYSEYGRRIAYKFTDKLVFDIQLTHDSIGYLPTKEAIEHGGYSTLHFSTFTDHIGGEFYVNSMINLLSDLISD